MRMVIDKICKMTVKSVKSKSESFFSISLGVLKVMEENLRGGFRSPPLALIGLRIQYTEILSELYKYIKFTNLINTDYTRLLTGWTIFERKF